MEGIQSAEKVCEDFDRLADLSSEDGWDHNAHYHAFLLKRLPAHCSEALEVGCGAGAFTRSLAERCDRVLAIDLSPRMVDVATDRSKEHQNLRNLCYTLPRFLWSGETTRHVHRGAFAFF